VASKDNRYFLIEEIFKNYSEYLSDDGKIILFAVDERTIKWCYNNCENYGLKIKEKIKRIDDNCGIYTFLIFERKINDIIS
jgi:hypothetical protein